MDTWDFCAKFNDGAAPVLSFSAVGRGLGAVDGRGECPGAEAFRSMSREVSGGLEIFIMEVETL